MRRRGFVKICASAVATVGANPDLLAAAGGPVHRYHRTRLVDGHGAPIRADGLPVGESLVFNYPYATTPCFLVDLGRPVAPEAGLETEAGETYRGVAGIGPGRSVVSFSAICAHKMSHPARAVSFINYRHEEVSFTASDQHTETRSGVIFCCSERSVYDPAKGARVLGGPAPQPLTTILLEEDEDGVHAVGTAGGEMYEKFFGTFSFRLALEHGTSNVRRLAGDTATVVPIAEYSRTRMMC